MSTFTEENYLKAIYKIGQIEKKPVTTNAIADLLQTKASSVTDMVKRLSDKGLVDYKKYQGVSLTVEGNRIAVGTIRKHRLWEVFLVDHLHFKWDEVHDVAEELEHIDSEKLIENLDNFLGYPKFDPHGDPIPDKKGNIYQHSEVSLADLKPEEKGYVVGVKDHSPSFLQYLEGMQLLLGTSIKVIKHFEFDDSLLISINDNKEIMLSNKVSKNLYISKKELK